MRIKTTIPAMIKAQNETMPIPIPAYPHQPIPGPYHIMAVCLLALVLRRSVFHSQPLRGTLVGPMATGSGGFGPKPSFTLCHVVEAGHHASFLVIGVVAVQHPDAGIVGDEGDADFLVRQHDGGVFACTRAAVGFDDLE